MRFALVLLTALASARASELSGWNETIVRYNGTGPVIEKNDYILNDPDRQFLRIWYTTDGPKRGVYVHAHGNGGDTHIPYFDRESVINAGYAFISWESITKIKSTEDTMQCQADHELVMKWIVANADAYNLDASNIIMGGRSRGSVVSWPLAYAKNESYTIRGIYMYNALPSDDLFNESNPDNALSYVTSESPPLFLFYGPECPKPINESCVPSPNPDDIHSPKYGQRIINKYDDLGLSMRAHLTDGRENANITNIMYHFPSFVDALPNVLVCTAGLESLCPNYKTGTKSDCAKCARSQKKKLFDARCDESIVVSLCTSASAIGADDAKLRTEDAMRSFIFEEADEEPQRTSPPITNDAVSALHFTKSPLLLAFVSALMLIPGR